MPEVRAKRLVEGVAGSLWSGDDERQMAAVFA
jgi:hypothetical protein